MKEITIVNIRNNGNFNSIEVPESLKLKKFKSYSAVAKVIEIGKTATVKVKNNSFLLGFGEVTPNADSSFFYPKQLNSDW